LDMAGNMERRRDSDGRNGRLYPPIVPQPNFKLGYQHRNA
jgi:hypothetical protein